MTARSHTRSNNRDRRRKWKTWAKKQPDWDEQQLAEATDRWQTLNRRGRRT